MYISMRVEIDVEGQKRDVTVAAHFADNATADEIISKLQDKTRSYGYLDRALKHAIKDSKNEQ